MLLFFIAGCDDDSTSPDPDVSMTDSGSMLDDSMVDMGLESDANEVTDATASLDANPSLDAGTDSSVVDSTIEDAGQDLDAGITDMEPVLLDGGLEDMAELDAELVNCVPPASHFEFVVWPTVFEGNCTQCHLPGGFAEGADAGFILHNVQNPDRESRDDALAYNLEHVIEFQNEQEEANYLIRKGLGELNHGGQARFAEGSAEHAALLDLFELIERFNDPDCVEVADDVPGYRDIFGRLELMDPEQTFRSFTTQVLGRLPSPAELVRIRGLLMGNGPNLNANERDERRPDNQRNDRRELSAVEQNQQMRVVQSLMAELMDGPEAKTWLKDAWNDVFMFRGIFAQELVRPYDVFHDKDFGARSWSDLCGIDTFLQDENGEFIIGPGRQFVCEIEHERFNYTEVIQPNPEDANNIHGQAVLSPVEACNYCRFTRDGIANWMLYGAVEEPLELIADTIQSRRPFTEILTTNDVMMNYYTSLVYYGTADPAVNEFTADMANVPMVPELKNGPNWARFQVDLPDHRHFKRLDRMRRTKFFYNRHYYPLFDEDGEPLLDGNGDPAEAYGQIRYMAYRSEINPPEHDDFPRAGILSSAAFMKRFASNEFNLHRHRGWQILRLFLDYDILENQGERISLADVDDPNGAVTRNSAECSSCHERLDPVSGLFKDFHPDGYSRSASDADDEWPAVIHQPGWPSIDGQPPEAHDRAMHGPPLPFLARKITESPRFARTMVKYAWQQLMGKNLEEVVGDPADENFEIRNTLLMARDRFFDGLVNTFVSSGYDMNRVYNRILTSQWYRIKGLKAPGADVVPDIVYEGIGRSGTITPEEYFRRIESLFGAPWPLRGIPTSDTRAGTFEEIKKRDFFTRKDTAFENFDLGWGMLDASFASFFGGVDFQNSLTRAEQVNSIMTLVTRRVANEFACLVVYDDLMRDQAIRRFFPEVRYPLARNEEVRLEEVRANVVHLFKYMLDVELSPDDAEIDLAVGLWEDARQSVLDDIAENPEAGRLLDHCRAHGSERRNDMAGVRLDRDGIVRAWMAVTTYLMLQPEMLQR